MRVIQSSSNQDMRWKIGHLDRIPIFQGPLGTATLITYMKIEETTRFKGTERDRDRDCVHTITITCDCQHDHATSEKREIV